jgi:hypothetical protein
LIDFIVDICVQSVVDPNTKTLGGLALVMTVSNRTLMMHA